MVDNAAPHAGVVFNTGNFRDIHVQYRNSVIEASWTGFEDHHSFIESYHMTVAKCSNITDIANEFTVNGFNNRAIFSSLNLQHNFKYCIAIKAVDAIGYESDLNISPPLLIDITPPEPCKCAFFQFIKTKTSTNSQGQSIWEEDISIRMEKYQFYKFNISTPTTDIDARVFISIMDVHTSFPFLLTDQHTLLTTYTFYSSYNIIIDANLELHGFKQNDSISIDFMQCQNIVPANNANDGLKLRQVAEDAIEVNIHVNDKESEIKSIEIGVGTTPGGFQIKDISNLGEIYHCIIPIPRSTINNVYVTAIATNHARMASRFSRSIAIDRTAPNIINPVVEISYTYMHNNQTHLLPTIEIYMQWNASDEETGIRHCAASLGKFTKRTCESITCRQ